MMIGRMTMLTNIWRIILNKQHPPSSKDIFYELENLSEIKDRTILKLFETDGSGRGALMIPIVITIIPLVIIVIAIVIRFIKVVTIIVIIIIIVFGIIKVITIIVIIIIIVLVIIKVIIIIDAKGPSGLGPAGLPPFTPTPFETGEPFPR